jgi:hypothetical protein
MDMSREPGQLPELAAAARADLDLGGAEAREREQGQAAGALEREQGPVPALGRGARVEHRLQLAELIGGERLAVVAHDAAAARELDVDPRRPGPHRAAHQLGRQLPGALQLRDRQLAQLRLDVDAQQLAQVDGHGVSGRG